MCQLTAKLFKHERGTTNKVNGKKRVITTEGNQQQQTATSQTTHRSYRAARVSNERDVKCSNGNMNNKRHTHSNSDINNDIKGTNSDNSNEDRNNDDDRQTYRHTDVHQTQPDLP